MSDIRWMYPWHFRIILRETWAENFRDNVTLLKSTEKCWLERNLNSHLRDTGPPLYLLSYRVHRDWRSVLSFGIPKVRPQIPLESTFFSWLEQRQIIMKIFYTHDINCGSNWLIKTLLKLKKKSSEGFRIFITLVKLLNFLCSVWGGEELVQNTHRCQYRSQYRCQGQYTILGWITRSLHITGHTVVPVRIKDSSHYSYDCNSTAFYAGIARTKGLSFNFVSVPFHTVLGEHNLNYSLVLTNIIISSINDKSNLPV